MLEFLSFHLMSESAMHVYRSLKASLLHCNWPNVQWPPACGWERSRHMLCAQNLWPGSFCQRCPLTAWLLPQQFRSAAVAGNFALSLSVLVGGQQYSTCAVIDSDVA